MDPDLPRLGGLCACVLFTSVWLGLRDNIFDRRSRVLRVICCWLLLKVGLLLVFRKSLGVNPLGEGQNGGWPGAFKGRKPLFDTPNPIMLLTIYSYFSNSRHLILPTLKLLTLFLLPFLLPTLTYASPQSGFFYRDMIAKTCFRKDEFW